MSNETSKWIVCRARKRAGFIMHISIRKMSAFNNWLSLARYRYSLELCTFGCRAMQCKVNIMLFPKEIGVSVMGSQLPYGFVFIWIPFWIFATSSFLFRILWFFLFVTTLKNPPLISHDNKTQKKVRKGWARGRCHEASWVFTSRLRHGLQEGGITLLF